MINITCPGVERGQILSPPVAMMLWGRRKILMKLTPDSEVWTIARNTRVFNLPITDNTTDVRILDSLRRRPPPLWGSVSALQRSFHFLELMSTSGNNNLKFWRPTFHFRQPTFCMVTSLFFNKPGHCLKCCCWMMQVAIRDWNNV